MSFRTLTLALLLCGATAASAQQAEYTNSIGMQFVLVEPGTMTVGRFEPPYAKPPDPNAPAPPAPPAAREGGAGGRAAGEGRGGPGGGRRGGRGGVPPTPDEYRRIEQAALADYRPGFPVTIERAYYLGRYEVTQAQWRRVMGNNPSVFQGDKVTGPSDDNPVDSVTWDDVQEFVSRLNALERTNAYRLPSEFEWEYAARSGVDDDIPWAEIRQQAFNSGQFTQAVGKMEPNAWGFYDMMGNVWEWVQDFYNEKIFADPTPPLSGTQRVLKGGGFTSDVKNLTYMWHGAGPGNGFDVGFRILREVP